MSYICTNLYNATHSDVHILQYVMYSTPIYMKCYCSEGRDRTFLSLPGHQEDLMNQVKATVKAPIIVVLMSGGPVDMTWAKVCVCGGVDVLYILHVKYCTVCAYTSYECQILTIQITYRM